LAELLARLKRAERRSCTLTASSTLTWATSGTSNRPGHGHVLSSRDSRPALNKGPQRPLSQDLRAEAIASLGMVITLRQPLATAEKTIKLLKARRLRQRPDYKDAAKDVTAASRARRGRALVGGELKITEDITFSSSNLINRHLPQFDPAVNLYLEGCASATIPTA